MATLGATAAGVCKGLQAVGVLAMSHLLFCGPDGTAAQAQCFNGLKGAASACVVGGVLLFSACPRLDPSAVAGEYAQVPSKPRLPSQQQRQRTTAQAPTSGALNTTV